MENSFFEYRDTSGVGSDSDTEVIDNSLVLDVSFTPRKKLGLKNLTVAESEESSTGGKIFTNETYFLWVKAHKEIKLIGRASNLSFVIKS